MTEQPNTTPSVDPIRPTHAQPTWEQSISQMDAYAERARVAMPAAPPGLMEGYMRFAPWVAIVFGVIGLVLLLAVSLLGAIVTPLAIAFGVYGVSAGAGAFLGLAAAIIGALLDIVGGWLMLQRRSTGWWLIAIGLIIALLGNLFRTSLLSLLLVLAISYVHLQVKPNYH